MNIQDWWRQARDSFWFLPTVIVGLCILSAVALIQIDVKFDGDWLDRWPQLFGAGAEGSRELLGVVASSMITVAGVVFSITIVALSLTSSQYSSRVLRNFMGDRSTQFVLGAFVGIFAYCLVVLRTIRGGDEGAFVPALAVLGGMTLGLAGIAVLIYFIHHIAVLIQAAQILAAIADETLRAVERLFPQEVGVEELPAAEEPPLNGRRWQSIHATKTGYLQRIDGPTLLKWAAKRQSVLRMERGIGEFVIESTPLAAVLTSTELSEDDVDQVISAFVVNRQRTVDQDAAFGIRQIVDVALKALSPGINDTTTAVMCVEYLTAILVRLSACRIESQFRGEDSELRLLTIGPSFGGLAANSFDQIRQNGGGNLAILHALVAALEQLEQANRLPSRRDVLQEHAELFLNTIKRTVPDAPDAQCLESRAQQILEKLSRPHIS